MVSEMPDNKNTRVSFVDVKLPYYWKADFNDAHGVGTNFGMVDVDCNIIMVDFNNHLDGDYITCNIAKSIVDKKKHWYNPKHTSTKKEFKAALKKANSFLNDLKSGYEKLD